jgi:hypothetical protein
MSDRPIAYYKWLKLHEYNRDKLAWFIISEAIHGNNNAFTLLEETGDKEYNITTGYKAADIILNLEDNG